MSLRKNYAVGDIIGSGSMATVHKGVQKSLDRLVAIKRIHPHLAESPEFVVRFEREAKASAHLKNVNIMDIIDFGVDEQHGYYLVMEYVDGPTLAKLMRAGGDVPLDVALAITHQILNGLEHAHNNGVVHRDVKPANIMLTSTGIVKIADFGVALASKLPSLTQLGQRIGTPAYMSPEQAEGKRVDQRSDLFSVGIILYEMLAHKAPFSGTDTEVRNQILTTTPPPLSTLDASVPAELDAILERALEKDPTNRFFDAGEFAFAIEGFAASSGLRLGARACLNFVKFHLEGAQKKEPAANAATASQIRAASPTTGAGRARPTAAILPLQGCFGCHVNILDLHEKLADLLNVVDVRFSYLMDIKQMPEVEIGIVEGAVCNVENEERLKAFRAKCKKLVTLGTCSSFGGLPGLRNLYSANEVIARAYGTAARADVDLGLPDSKYVPALCPAVRAVSAVVPVEGAIPGCPPPPSLVLTSLSRLVEGTSLGLPTHNLCFECKRRHKNMLISQRAFVAPEVVAPMELERIDPNACFLEQGVLCMGIATREGCGARCTSDNAPCQGCLGPPPASEEIGAKWMDALASLLPGGALRFRNDIVGNAYRYTLPTSIMPMRKQEGS